MSVLNVPTIKRLYLLRIIHSSWIYVPVLVLFYQSRGLSLTDILILKSFFSLFIVLFEVPTGYIADQIGRKHCLVWGSIAFLISTPINILGNSFEYFICADFILAIALSLISGADVALAYDSLLDLGREKEYPILEKKMSSVMGWSEGFGAILGGILASFDVTYPFYAHSLLMIASLFCSLTIHEPKKHGTLGIKSGFKDILKTAKFAYFDNKYLRSIIGFSAVSGAATFLIVWYSQAYMDLVHIPVAWFGILWACFHFVMAISSSLYLVLESRVGKNNVFRMMAILQGISLVLMGLITNWFGIFFILILYAVRGIRSPFIRAEINKLVPSDIRATVLSLDSFAFRIVFVFLGLFMGIVSQYSTLSQSFMLSGIIILLAGMYTVKLVSNSQKN